MKNLSSSILETVGETPLVHLQRLTQGLNGQCVVELTSGNI